MPDDHVKFMQLSLSEARRAGSMGEVPVGAVLVTAGGDILAAACNQPITLNDPSAHAEILALRAAGQKIQNYRLLNTVLYVTVEPCPMCMGALVHARVAQIVFGVPDPKWGAAGSLYNFAANGRLNHRPEIIRGICETECAALMRDFFAARRS